LLFVALAGCSASSSQAPAQEDTDASATDDGAMEAAPPPTYAPTYTAVWKEILSPKCAGLFCHGASGDYLQLADKPTGYMSLVNTPAGGPMCAPTGLLRVDPGHPETSLFYLKVSNPPCGMKMPALGAGTPLDDKQLQQVHDWIAMGAQND
jgi:hypothetical protein